MKKFVAIIIALLLLVSAALPLIIGWGLTFAARLAIESVPVSSAFAIEDVQINSGYFSSQYHLVLKPKIEGETQSIALDLQLQHGPVLNSPQITFGWLGAQLQATILKESEHIKTQSAQLPAYQLQGKIGFGADAEFTDRYQPLELIINGAKLHWDAGSGGGQFKLAQGKLTYQGQLGFLNFSSADFQINLAPAVVNKEVSISNTGEFSWLSRIAFTTGGGHLNREAFNLVNGAMGISRAPTDRHDRLQLSLVAEQFVAPGVALNVLDANFALHQLPKDWLMQLVEQLSQGHADNATLLQHMAGFKADFQRENSQLQIERFGAAVQDKPFWLTGQAPLAKLVAIPAESFADLSALLAVLEAKVDLTLDKALLVDGLKAYIDTQNPGAMSLAQIEVLAQAFVAQGLFASTGEMYTTSLTLKPGEITLNDKPLPLPY